RGSDSPKAHGPRAGPDNSATQWSSCGLRCTVTPTRGVYWEEKCDMHVKSVGFIAIADWGSCYFQQTLRLSLVIYVDDFKLSGGTKNLTEGWRFLRKGLTLDYPTPLEKFLGCDHYQCSAALRKGVLVPISEGKGAANTYTGVSAAKLRNTYTPLVDGNCEWSDLSSPNPDGVPTKQKSPGHRTPATSGTLTIEDSEQRGALASVAVRMIMKILYAARMARFDL
ncbi:hypothetical protein N9L68_08205, partial [bacterium]|nr:hypothetical protein [bacterium]